MKESLLDTTKIKAIESMLMTTMVTISRTAKYTEEIRYAEIFITVNRWNEESEKENSANLRRLKRNPKGQPEITWTSWRCEKGNKRLYRNRTYEKRKWMKAIQEEIKSLKNNITWDLVELIPNKRIIGSKLTFKAKLNENGDIDCYKACFIAKGYNKKSGSKYDETFAPVVKLTTIRAYKTHWH